MRTTLAALAVTLPVLAACSTGVDPAEQPFQAGDVQAGEQGPDRVGEPVTALQADGPPYGYEVVVQDSADGLCVELRDDQDGSSVGCGFEVPERHDLGFFRHRGPGQGPTQDLVVGQVLPAATAVVLEYAQGPAGEADVTPVASLGVAVFAAPVDPERDLEAVVVVAGDEELERRTANGA